MRSSTHRLAPGQGGALPRACRRDATAAGLTPESRCAPDVRRQSQSGRRAAGVTLIELLIVVAVVGILAALAYPSYTAYRVRANRAAAQSFLVDLANRQ